MTICGFPESDLTKKQPGEEKAGRFKEGRMAVIEERKIVANRRVRSGCNNCDNSEDGDEYDDR